MAAKSSDSSSVRLRPDVAARGGSGKLEPLTNLLTGLERGTLVGDAVPALAKMPVMEWSVGKQPVSEGAFASFGPKASAVLKAQAPNADHLERVLRHELLGHGTQLGWRTTDTFTAPPKGQHSQAYVDLWHRLHELSSGRSPKTPEQLAAYNSAAREIEPAQKMGGYLAQPNEVLARAVENPFAYDPTTAPSQRNWTNADTVQRREHAQRGFRPLGALADEPSQSWSFPFEAFGPSR